MSKAALSISVIERRMLKKSEAAEYVSMAEKHFQADCPVKPMELRPGEFRWDKRDLDRWIDAQKSGFVMSNDAAILERL